MHLNPRFIAVLAFAILYGSAAPGQTSAPPSVPPTRSAAAPPALPAPPGRFLSPQSGAAVTGAEVPLSFTVPTVGITGGKVFVVVRAGSSRHLVWAQSFPEAVAERGADTECKAVAYCGTAAGPHGLGDTYQILVIVADRRPDPGTEMDALPAGSRILASTRVVRHPKPSASSSK